MKQTAQDAHEAIRPTSMAYPPDTVRAYLSPDQFYLYRLIWNRFVASQMVPATFDDTTVEISAPTPLLRGRAMEKVAMALPLRSGFACSMAIANVVALAMAKPSM